MKFQVVPSLEKRPHVDACVVPFVQDEDGKICPLFSDPHLLHLCHRLLETQDFHAKEGEVVVVYPDPVHEVRLVVVGLGEKDKISIETIRSSFASVVSTLTKKQVRTISVLPPIGINLSVKMVLRGVLEGISFGSYTFRLYRSSWEGSEIASVSILCEEAPVFHEVERQVRACMEAVSLARDLVNRNADEITPEGFVKEAMALATDSLQVTDYDADWIKAERMGLLLAVSQGSRYAPHFLLLEWKGAESSQDTTVLVGKGITFDSGGLNLKTAENMKDMKTDMAGAAAVLAVMRAIRDLRLNINVVAAIPLCENSIGCEAYKPGDVYRSRSGKTVEIANTDAEGRLILADALSYVKERFSPSRIIDVATLTGAAEVALGNDISALFSNSDALSYQLETASHHAGESLWRMPLHVEYAKLLESDIADWKNVATRVGGAINAAVFLYQFVGEIPWVHFDIAGTAFLQKSLRYFGKGATGVPVRTLVEFFLHLNDPEAE